jgi:hypothetical protein
LALHRPLQEILTTTQALWPTNGRPEVVTEFRKVVDCRTLALGAEVYRSSGGDERIVPHTCKSRVCPSCGQRNNLQWLRERWCNLPEIPYSHVVLTMPDHFWPLFRDNRHLLNDLPSLGAEVIQQWVKKKHGAKLLLAVIPHTFGRDLKFNCHLHILASQGGLSSDESSWLSYLPLNMKAIMKMWRYAVVTFLRMAYRRGLLATKLRSKEFYQLLDDQYQWWWHVYCGAIRNKGQVLRYAGRYVRRPPIAEHRILQAGPEQVRFLTKDLKTRSTVETCYSVPEFIERLSHQVPDRYVNNIRYFGLLAPRTKGRLYDFLFHLLGQNQRPRPKRLPWAAALKRYFGTDPLRDDDGNPMRWSGRLMPQRYR